MAKLPRNLNLPQMTSTWANAIDPVINNPINSASVLKSISLKAGANSVNHLLGAPLQGWLVCRQRASASFYDTQDSNPTPQLTLNLVSSAPVVVDIVVW